MLTSRQALGSAPLTPNSAVSPSVPPSPSADGRPKKSNPLLDLIDTEKLYVDLLTGIIRVRVSRVIRCISHLPILHIESRCGMVSFQFTSARVGYHVPKYRGYLQG